MVSCRWLSHGWILHEASICQSKWRFRHFSQNESRCTLILNVNFCLRQMINNSSYEIQPVTFELYVRKIYNDANAFSTDGTCVDKVCATFAIIESKFTRQFCSGLIYGVLHKNIIFQIFSKSTVNWLIFQFRFTPTSAILIFGPSHLMLLRQ